MLPGSSVFFFPWVGLINWFVFLIVQCPPQSPETRPGQLHRGDLSLPPPPILILTSSPSGISDRMKSTCGTPSRWHLEWKPSRNKAVFQMQPRISFKGAERSYYCYHFWFFPRNLHQCRTKTYSISLGLKQKKNKVEREAFLLKGERLTVNQVRLEIKSTCKWATDGNLDPSYWDVASPLTAGWENPACTTGSPWWAAPQTPHTRSSQSPSAEPGQAGAGEVTDQPHGTDALLPDRPLLRPCHCQAASEFPVWVWKPSAHNQSSETNAP